MRDDHLCEERGLRATQELLREKLLRPLKRIWDEHSRSWCCGVKIRPEDQALYGQLTLTLILTLTLTLILTLTLTLTHQALYGQRRKRKGGIIDVE